MISDDTLAAWERASAEGSRGEWRAITSRNTGAVMTDAEGCYVYLNCDAVSGPESQERWHADARFIALARTAVPQLIAEVRRLRQAMKEIASAVNEESDDPAEIVGSVIGNMGALGMFQEQGAADTKRLDEIERFVRWAHDNAPELNGVRISGADDGDITVTVLGPDDCFTARNLRQALDDATLAITDQ